MHIPLIRPHNNHNSMILAPQTNKANAAKSRRQRIQARTPAKPPQKQPQRWNICTPLNAVSKLSAYHSFCTLVSCVSAGVAAYKVIQNTSDQHIKNTVPVHIQSSLLGLYALTAAAEAGIAIITAYIAVQTFYGQE